MPAAAPRVTVIPPPSRYNSPPTLSPPIGTTNPGPLYTQPDFSRGMPPPGNKLPGSGAFNPPPPKSYYEPPPPSLNEGNRPRTAQPVPISSDNPVIRGMDEANRITEDYYDRQYGRGYNPDYVDNGPLLKAYDPRWRERMGYQNAGDAWKDALRFPGDWLSDRLRDWRQPNRIPDWLQPHAPLPDPPLIGNKPILYRITFTGGQLREPYITERRGPLSVGIETTSMGSWKMDQAFAYPPEGGKLYGAQRDYGDAEHNDPAIDMQLEPLELLPDIPTTPTLPPFDFPNYPEAIPAFPGIAPAPLLPTMPASPLVPASVPANPAPEPDEATRPTTQPPNRPSPLRFPPGQRGPTPTLTPVPSGSPYPPGHPYPPPTPNPAPYPNLTPQSQTGITPSSPYPPIQPTGDPYPQTNPQTQPQTDPISPPAPPGTDTPDKPKDKDCCLMVPGTGDFLTIVACDEKDKRQRVALPKPLIELVEFQSAQLRELSKLICQINAVASVPEWWQLRAEAQRPQLVVIYAEVFATGKLSTSRWSLAIPHYNRPKSYKPNFPDYNKGNAQGTLTLKDNSKIIVNCESITEAKRLLNRLKTFIPVEYRMVEGKAIKGKYSELEGANFKRCRVTPIRADFYSTGLRNLAPDWSINLRRKE